MPTIKILPHVIFLAAAITGLAAGSSNDNSQLRLSASTGAVLFERFTVEKDRILAFTETGAHPLPRDVAWRLDGDLWAQSHFILFSPEYEIVRRASLDPSPSAPTGLHAIIRVRRNIHWDDPDVAGAVMIVVWLTDGKPTTVMTVVPSVAEGPSADFAAVAVVELTEPTARGAPAVLLLRDGRFIAPKPWFKEESANAALAAMYLDSAEKFTQAVQSLPSAAKTTPRTVDRSESFLAGNIENLTPLAARLGALTTPDKPALNQTKAHATLLHFAAEGGFTRAVEVLLADGRIAPASATKNGWLPLDYAAANGRVECERLLLAAQGTRPGWNDNRGPALQKAMNNGHVVAARDLLGGKPGSEMNQVARLAALEGDGAVLKELLGVGAKLKASDLTPDSLVRAIRLRNAELLQALFLSGLGADTNIDEVPALLLAAEVGDAKCIAAMLAAGAMPDRTAPHKVTPLMHVLASGSVECVDLLLRAGANVNLADDAGLAALHYAVLAAKPELASRLMAAGAHIDARDANGRSALDIALEMHAAKVVQALVQAGARLDRQSHGFATAVENAVELDEISLVRQVVAEGWNPATLFRGEWPAVRVAQMCHAESTAAWLTGILPAAPAGGPQIESFDVSPTLQGGEAPPEVRTDETCAAISVTVAGTVDVRGQFLFPIVRNCPDERVASAVLSIVPTWKFQPAKLAGRPVNIRVTLPVQLPARDRHVCHAAEIGTPPEIQAAVAAALDQRVVKVFRNSETQSTTVTTTTPNPDGSTTTRTQVNTSVLPAEPEPTTVISTGHWAVVTLIVSPDGKPSAVQVIGAASSSYGEAVLEAVQKYRFRPGLREGHPVRTRMSFAVKAEP